MTYIAKGIGEESSTFESENWDAFIEQVKMLFDFAKQNGNGMSIIIEENHSKQG